LSRFERIGAAIGSQDIRYIPAKGENRQGSKKDDLKKQLSIAQLLFY